MIVKKFAVAALLLVLFSIMPIALADDTNEIMDANTAQEVKVMTSPYGAEVRLLQLEKSVTRNVLVGATVIEIIQKNHVDANVTDAQNVLDQMEALIVDIKSVDLTADKNVLVTNFVAMKKEATDLSKQFRESTATSLDVNDKQEIKEAVKELDKNELKGINENIKNRVRMHNAQTITALLQRMGTTNPQLVQRIVDGNATAEEVKQAVVTAFEDLNMNEKQLAGAKIKENAIKRMVAEKEMIQNARNKAMQKILERDQNKLNRMSEWLKNKANDLNANGFEDRAKRIENMNQQIENIAEKIGEWQPRPRGQEGDSEWRLNTS